MHRWHKIMFFAIVKNVLMCKGTGRIYTTINIDPPKLPLAEFVMETINTLAVGEVGII
jgi:hypothetical protein